MGLNTILKFITEKTELILVGLLAVAIVFAVSQCDAKKEFKAEVTQQKNNIEALNDSVETYKNKAGELTSEKLALQTDKKQLKSLNKDLSNELEKERGKVEQISKLYARIKGDTLKADTTHITEINISNWRFNWNFSRQGDGWSRYLEGYTAFKIDTLGYPHSPKSVLTKDYLNLQIVTGITEDDGKKSIFVRSNYPNMEFTNIQGAIIEDDIPEPSPSRFGLGLHTGWGYAPQNGFTPYIGIGINYNLINF